MTPGRYWLYFLLCGFLSAVAASFVWMVSSVLILAIMSGESGLGFIVVAALIGSIFGGIIGLPVTLAGGAIMRFAELKRGWTHWAQWFGCGALIGALLSLLWYAGYGEGMITTPTFAIGGGVGALAFRYLWHLKVKVGQYNERDYDETMFR